MTVTASETTTTAYGRLLDLAREASLLGSTAQLLGWDQEVIMPKGGLDYRILCFRKRTSQTSVVAPGEAAVH